MRKMVLTQQIDVIIHLAREMSNVKVNIASQTLQQNNSHPHILVPLKNIVLNVMLQNFFSTTIRMSTIMSCKVNQSAEIANAIGMQIVLMGFFVHCLHIHSLLCVQTINLDVITLIKLSQLKIITLEIYKKWTLLIAAIMLTVKKRVNVLVTSNAGTLHIVAVQNVMIA